MAREFFKNLPDTTTPLNAQRMNAFLNGEEAMGSIVVDDIKSKNMFNKYDVIDGYYWATGKLTKDSAMCCTNSFIKVEPNKTYTFSCGTKSTIFIEEYDENQTYIKLNSNWDLTKVSITTSSTTEYVKLSFTKAAKDTTQFEKGTATEYTPYKNFEGRTDIITGQECPTNEYVDGKRVYVNEIDFGIIKNHTNNILYSNIVGDYTIHRVLFKGYKTTERQHLSLPYFAAPDLYFAINTIIIDNRQCVAYTKVGDYWDDVNLKCEFYYTKN